MGDRVIILCPAGHNLGATHVGISGSKFCAKCGKTVQYEGVVGRPTAETYYRD